MHNIISLPHEYAHPLLSEEGCIDITSKSYFEHVGCNTRMHKFISFAKNSFIAITSDKKLGGRLMVPQ